MKIEEFDEGVFYYRAILAQLKSGKKIASNDAFFRDN